MTVVLFCLITLMLRAFPGEHRARRILFVYLFCLAGLVMAWSLTPPNVWIFGPSLLTQPPFLDLILSVFFLVLRSSAAFCSCTTSLTAGSPYAC